MSSALSRFVAPKASAQPLDSIPALWRGQVAEVRADGTVWVRVPRLSGPELIGPIPTIVAGLVAGNRVVVAAMENSRNDFVVLARFP